MLGELSGGSYQPTRAYTWGANGLVSQRRTNTNSSDWFAFGPQGETRCLTDSQGQVWGAAVYTAWGVPVSNWVDSNFLYGGQYGYYSVGGGTAILCGARWHNPSLGHWLSRDPVGYEGGPNLYEYCESDPVGFSDESGTNRNGGMLDYLASRDYWSDVWAFGKGEAAAANPVNWVRGIGAAGAEIWNHGWTGAGNVVSGLWQGLQFWNQPDMNSAGQSFMGDVLLASPLIGRIPNPTRFRLYGPYGSGIRNFTLFAIDRGGHNIFRIDVGPLPNKSTIPPCLRGRVSPHYHRLGRLGPSGDPLPGHGLGKHRPWQGGPGPRF